MSLLDPISHALAAVVATAHTGLTSLGADPGAGTTWVLCVAAVVVTVRLTNTGPTPLDVEYAETVLSNPTLMLNRAPVGGVRPVRFVNRARPLPGGRSIVCDATATSDDPH